MSADDSRKTAQELVEQGIDGVQLIAAEHLAACDEWLAFALREVDPWPGRPLDDTTSDNILAVILGRSINTFWSITELARMGFGEQAVMLTRPLFEDMVDAHWVCVEPALARERLTQHLDHSRLLFNETAADFPAVFDPASLPDADPSQRPALDEIFGRFGHKSWTGLDIHSRSAAIEHLWVADESRTLFNFFRRVVYRDSNQHLHLSGQALNGLVRANTGEHLSVKVGPGPESVSRALWSSWWMSTQILGHVFEHFEFPEALRTEMAAVIGRGAAAFTTLSKKAMAKTGRNDQCPCGSGRKFKHCHGA